MSKKILVVDDEKAITFAIGRYFSHRGFAVDAVTDAEEATRMIASNHYALAIVDVRLSGGKKTEGLDLARYLREKNAAIPIILMTANGTPDVMRQAERIGVNSFVHKPKPLAELAALAHLLLDAAPQTA